jgi:hypothetical protein
MKKKYPGGVKKPRIITETDCDTAYRYSWLWEGIESLRQIDLKYRKLEIKEGIELYHS